ncbi:MULTISPECIES: hypothetical protein [Pseudanabaena]|uniref:Uncharacterized protein n=2 Tax=Pseudanabaena TaxID=1152 RepID=L8N154_9CYAN|nr:MULTISPECIES: hypothetical protein [Pseudanabaena]ELS32475.1 hypothetical protein Pse7429DRAFT_2419 [Pseudanabaena biceps PCC 7429]MDG3495296.1 hypothetical protein [Pseudanabaena catenata USMAC16]
MEDSSLLEEVIDSLEQDSNVLRIKRLILFTCHDSWSNDVNEVKALHVRELVRELMILFPDLNMLKHKLNSHVKQLSKQSDYLLAADNIIDSLGFLYTLRDEGKLPHSFLNPEVSNVPVSQSISSHDLHEKNDFDTVPHRHNLKHLTNLFDLRADISRNISPLHAKILLFSTLNYRFSPQERDWSALYTYDIDDLIQTLFQTYETFESLEKRLAEVCLTLDQPEDAKRASAVILQALKPFY